MKDSKSYTSMSFRYYRKSLDHSRTKSQFYLPSPNIAKNRYPTPQTDNFKKIKDNTLPSMDSNDIKQIKLIYQYDYTSRDKLAISRFQSLDEILQNQNQWKQIYSEIVTLLNDNFIKRQNKRNKSIERNLVFNQIQKEQMEQQLQFDKYQITTSTIMAHVNEKHKFQNMPKIRLKKKKLLLGDEEEMLVYEKQEANNQQEEQKKVQQRGNLKYKKKQDKNELAQSQIPVIKILKIFVSVNSYVNHDLDIIGSLKYSLINKPSPRIGATLNLLGDRIIMFGGIGKDLDEHVYELKLPGFIWSRQGHSSVQYKKQLVYFGGERRFNKTIKIRECLNELLFFNQENKFAQADTLGEKPEPRSYHGCALVNKFLFIIGGINQNAKYLNSVFYLNLENFKWNRIEISNFFNQGIAYHKAFSAFTQPIKLENMLIQYEYVEPLKNKKKFQEEGIFFYGGKLENGSYLEDLHCIKIGTNPITLKKISTIGQPPQSRYMHGLVYNEITHQMVVIGGKNENLGIFHDVHLLHIPTLSWQCVELYGYNQIGRFGLGITYYNQKIIIFGGCNWNNYYNPDILIFDLDQVTSRTRIKDLNLQYYYCSRSDKLSTYMSYEQNTRLNQSNRQIQLDKPIPSKKKISQQNSPLTKRSQQLEIDRSQLMSKLDIHQFQSIIPFNPLDFIQQ